MIDISHLIALVALSDTAISALLASSSTLLLFLAILIAIRREFAHSTRLATNFDLTLTHFCKDATTQEDFIVASALFSPTRFSDSVFCFLSASASSRIILGFAVRSRRFWVCITASLPSFPSILRYLLLMVAAIHNVVLSAAWPNRVCSFTFSATSVSSRLAVRLQCYRGLAGNETALSLRTSSKCSRHRTVVSSRLTRPSSVTLTITQFNHSTPW